MQNDEKKSITIDPLDAVFYIIGFVFQLIGMYFLSIGDVDIWCTFFMMGIVIGIVIGIVLLD